MDLKGGFELFKENRQIDNEKQILFLPCTFKQYIL